MSAASNAIRRPPLLGKRAGNTIGRSNLDGSNVEADFISAAEPTGLGVAEGHIYWISPATLSTSPAVSLNADTIRAITTLKGANAPTGTISFDLFGPGDETCTGTPLASNTVPVSGNGPYRSTEFIPTQAGTYRWRAAYSGDAENDPVNGACEGAVTVTPASPSTPLALTPKLVAPHRRAGTRSSRGQGKSRDQHLRARRAGALRQAPQEGRPRRLQGGHREARGLPHRSARARAHTAADSPSRDQSHLQAKRRNGGRQAAADAPHQALIGQPRARLLGRQLTLKRKIVGVGSPPPGPKARTRKTWRPTPTRKCRGERQRPERRLSSWQR
jgi:hypothetical protein